VESIFRAELKNIRAMLFVVEVVNGGNLCSSWDGANVYCMVVAQAESFQQTNPFRLEYRQRYACSIFKSLY
jgi:hypothetical protein